MKIGVDYHPEHWDKSLWRRDAELMAQNGVKLVRFGDISWTRVEPREGKYDFEWLDQAIAAFKRFNMDIVLCIPTNCPPQWMYEAHPDIVRTDKNGKKPTGELHDARCLNDPTFRYYAKRLTEQFILLYGANSSVAMWQIDDRIEAYPCCCDFCKDKFRKWLLDKYDSIDNINKVMGNNSHYGKYRDASHIFPPLLYPKKRRDPALALEYARFQSDCAIEFARELAMTIKSSFPKAKVTTNTVLGMYLPDLFKLYSFMDVAAFNNYPPTEIYDDGEVIDSHAFYLDLMRGLKGKDFWVMEQLSGPVGVMSVMTPAPKPNMLKGYSLQALAHGADTVIHFRWRNPISGPDMFKHGILDHSNVPGRRYYEFSELCMIASRLNVIDTTELVSDIAIIYSPESEKAIEIQPQADYFTYIEQLRLFHSAFSRYGANIDIIPPEADLTRYKVVVAPVMYVLNKKASENIYRYVIGGGTLIMTNRSGVKDEYNNCIMDALPTVYKELIGAVVSEYDPIGNGERSIRDFAGNNFVCRQWCDILALTTAKAYAEYSDDFYKGCPAVTMNRYCGGVAYYVGTICDNSFYESFAGNVMLQTGIPKLKGLPKGVEVTTRTNGLDEYIFFFNNSGLRVSIPLPKAMFSLIEGTVKEKLELRPFDMEIVRK